MKNCRMKQKMHPVGAEVHGLLARFRYIYERIQVWESYPNECAATDSSLEYIFELIEKLDKDKLAEELAELKVSTAKAKEAYEQRFAKSKKAKNP